MQHVRMCHVCDICCGVSAHCEGLQYIGLMLSECIQNAVVDSTLHSVIVKRALPAATTVQLFTELALAAAGIIPAEFRREEAPAIASDLVR